MINFNVKFELIVVCRSNGQTTREVKRPNKQVDSRSSLMSRLLNVALLQLLIQGVEWVFHWLTES